MDNTTAADLQYLDSQADPNAVTTFTPTKVEPFPLTEVQQAVIGNAGLSFQDPPAVGNTISFVNDGATTPPSPRLVKTKAVKAAYGGDQDPKQTEDLIAAGKENLAREKMSYEEDVKWQQQRNTILRNIVEESKGQVTPEQLDVLNSMTKDDFKNNPKIIFEKKFAQKYIRDKVVESAVESPNGVWGGGFKQNATALTKQINQGVNLMAQADIVNNIVHEFEEEAKSRGVFESVLGHIWGATPGVAWANHVSVLKDVGWSYAGLVGHTKRQQLNSLWAIRDLGEFERKTRETLTELKKNSFYQAKEFAEALKGFSGTDEVLMSSAMVADLTMLPVGRAASGAAKFLGADRIAAAWTANKAVKPVVSEADKFTFIGGKETYAASKMRDMPPIPEIIQDVARQSKFEPYQLDLFKMAPDELPLGLKHPTGEGTGPIKPGIKSIVTEDQVDDLGRLRTRGDPNIEGLPPGKLRSTYKPVDEQLAEGERKSRLAGTNVGTGRFEVGQGRYRQGELPLEGGLGQRSFDFSSPGMKKAVEEAIDRQIVFAGYTKAATKMTDEMVANGAVKPSATSASTVPSGVYGTAERVTPKWQEAPIRPLDMLPSNMNPTKYFENSLHRRADVAAMEAKALIEQFGQRLDESLRVRRIPSAVEKQAADEAIAKLMRNNAPRFGDGVIDGVHLPSELFRSNTGQAVLRVGDPRTKTPFLSREQAELFAENPSFYGLSKDEYRIYVGHNNDYYIGISANISENSDRTLNIIKELRHSPLNELIPRLKNWQMRDSVVPSADIAQRKVAQHAQQELRYLVMQQAKFFKELGREGTREVERAIEEFGKQRKWFETGREFEKEFQNIHKHLPTEKQVEAAYRYKLMQDHDFLLRNAGMYRDMARVGTEQHAVMLEKALSEYFNGIQLDKLPWGRGEDFTIAVYRAGDKTATVGYAHQAERLQGQLSKKEIDDLITQKGATVIQIHDPASKPLEKMGLTDAHVNYLVVDAGSATKPLNWQQLKYEPGPHSIYPYEWYVKQPKIATGHLGRTIYYGDNTLWNFSSKAEADMWLERLNVARVKVNEGALDAEAYITANLPYHNRAEFLKLKSQFDFSQPFATTKRGSSVFETQKDLSDLYPDAINHHKSSHNPQNFMDRTFLQERDDLLNVPSQAGGVMKFVKAKQLDAYDALDRGLNQSIRGMWLNDEKIRTAVQWVEQYKAAFEMSNPDSMRAIPMWAVFNAPLKRAPSGSDMYNLVVAAEAERTALRNFIGQQTDWGNEIGHAHAKIMDTIFKTGGRDTADWAAQHSLSFIKDPARYFRTAAAHPVIGMFNPIPLIQQSLVAANAVAVVPQHGWKAVTGAWLVRASEHTGEAAVFDKAAKMAESFGWKRQHFKEANEGYRSSGLNIVGKEATMRNDLADAHLFRSAWGAVADKGFLFFNAGERFGRKTAYLASYSEWRAANPTAKFTEEVNAGIIQRADTITGHMTAASQANALQGAIPSVALQFTTYYNHMAQLMLGKELTTMEKVRLFAMNSALYGVPAGLGAGGIAGGITAATTSTMQGRGLVEGAGMTAAGVMGFSTPYDDIMEYAKLNSIDMSPSYIQLAMKGIPNMIVQLATGGKVSPDVNKVYGLGANGWIRDMLRNDKDFFSVISGASGGLYGNVINALEPFMMRAADSITGANEFSDLKTEDFVRAARTIKSLDLAAKVWGVASAGKYMMNKGNNVPAESGFSMDTILTAFNLSPQEYQEAMLNFNVGKNIKDAQKKYETFALEAQRKGIVAMRDGDPDLATAHFRDATAYMKLGDFNSADQHKIRMRATSEAFGLPASSTRSLIRKLPWSQQIERALPEHFRKEP